MSDEEVIEVFTDTYTLWYRWESSDVRGDETGVLVGRNKAHKDRRIKISYSI